MDARGILEEFGEREFVPELEVFVRKWTPKPIFYPALILADKGASPEPEESGEAD